MKHKLYLTLLLMSALCQGQAQAPQTPVVQTRKFWTRQNTALISGITAATAVDAYTTDRGFESYRVWHEHNPVLRAVGTTRSGRVAYFSVTYAGAIAGAWLLTRSGHPRAAQWALRVQLGVETQAAVWTGTH